MRQVQVDQQCANGHDLTVEDAFVYSSTGLRSCRQCLQAVRKRPKFKNDIATVNRWAG